MPAPHALFDPALIGTFEARLEFLQQSLAYAGSTGVAEHVPSFGLRLSQNPVLDRVELRSAEIIRVITLTDARGVAVWRLVPEASGRSAMLDLAALASGTYLATVTDPRGQHSSVVLVKQ